MSEKGGSGGPCQPKRDLTSTVELKSITLDLKD